VADPIQRGLTASLSVSHSANRRWATGRIIYAFGMAVKKVRLIGGICYLLDSCLFERGFV
jgi:hypothetical protein